MRHLSLISTAAFLLCLSACTKKESSTSAPAAFSTFDEKTGKVQCIPPLDALVIQELQNTPTHQKRNRAGVYDLLLPSNEEELRSLNSMAVIAIRIYSRKQDDFPVQRLVVIPKDTTGVTEILPRVFPREEMKIVSDSRADFIFGSAYAEAYFFIPIRSLMKPGELSVVFRDKLTAFTIGRFPITIESEFLKKAAARKDGLIPNEKKIPDPARVAELIKRRYCW